MQCLFYWKLISLCYWPKCENTLKVQLIFPSKPNFCNFFEFPTTKSNKKKILHFSFKNCELHSIRYYSLRAFQHHQECPQVLIQFLLLISFNFHWENNSIINNFHICSSKLSQTKLMHLLIESFPKISKVRHEAPWFGRFQHNKIKQNK